MHEIRITYPDGSESRCEIKESGFTIGSSPDCDLTISSLNVSDVHAELLIEENAVTIRDMGTLMGTLVNGEPVTERKLENNDEILIDAYQIIYKRIYQQGNVELAATPSASGIDSVIGSVIDKRVTREKEKTAHSTGSLLLEDDYSVLEELELESKADTNSTDFWELIRPVVEEILTNLQTLVRIGKIINSELDLDTLLNLIMEQTVNLMKAERGFIVLHHRKTGKLDVVVARGITEKLEGEDKRLFSSNAIRKVIGDGQPYYSSNVIEDKSIEGGSKFMHQVRSCICVPLKCRGDVIGALYIDHTGTSVRFKPTQVKFLESFAVQAAIAIENARLYKMAVTDALTGLFTNQHFMHRLDAEIDKSGEDGTPFSLLILDLDNFERINAKYGHNTGDAVIRKVAETIRETVGKAGIPARYEGQKFAVILPSTPAVEARDMAENIRHGIKTRLINTQHGNIYVTISVGVAVCDIALTAPTAGSEQERVTAIDRQTLFEQADRALRAAKESGRNRVIVFESVAGNQSEAT